MDTACYHGGPEQLSIASSHIHLKAKWMHLFRFREFKELRLSISDTADMLADPNLMHGCILSRRTKHMPGTGACNK